LVASIGTTVNNFSRIIDGAGGVIDGTGVEDNAASIVVKNTSKIIVENKVVEKITRVGDGARTVDNSCILIGNGSARVVVYVSSGFVINKLRIVNSAGVGNGAGVGEGAGVGDGAEIGDSADGWEHYFYF